MTAPTADDGSVHVPSWGDTVPWRWRPARGAASVAAAGLAASPVTVAPIAAALVAGGAPSC